MEEDGMQALGFMFDSEHEKTYIEYTFRDSLSVKIKTIGENPGHKQSGQYVWPAAKALAEYLMDHRSEGVYSTAKSIVEMGSGCGIGGIVAAKVLPSCSSLILTDYDPGALALIDDNIALNEVGATCKTSFLEWGNLEATESKAVAGSVDAVIGADLIYSKDVVFPLMLSVKAAFASPEAVFLLVTSFSLGEGIEQIITDSCRQLGFHRRCLQEGQGPLYHGCRIEEYSLI